MSIRTHYHDASAFGGMTLADALADGRADVHCGTDAASLMADAVLDDPDRLSFVSAEFRASVTFAPSLSAVSESDDGSTSVSVYPSADLARLAFLRAVAFLVDLPDAPVYAEGEAAPLVESLARAFASRLALILSPSDLETCADYACASTCRTHDFCDPNKTMAACFAFIVGRDPDPASSSDASLIDASWSLARANRFYLIA